MFFQLADGNSVSEAAIGSMATVRSFDAAEGELKDFEGFMKQYLHLNKRSAFMYFGYCSVVTALPQLLVALVLFYGGLPQRWLGKSAGSRHHGSIFCSNYLAYNDARTVTPL